MTSTFQDDSVVQEDSAVRVSFPNFGEKTVLCLSARPDRHNGCYRRHDSYDRFCGEYGRLVFYVDSDAINLCKKFPYLKVLLSSITSGIL